MAESINLVSFCVMFHRRVALHGADRARLKSEAQGRLKPDEVRRKVPYSFGRATMQVGIVTLFPCLITPVNSKHLIVNWTERSR